MVVLDKLVRAESLPIHLQGFMCLLSRLRCCSLGECATDCIQYSAQPRTHSITQRHPASQHQARIHSLHVALLPCRHCDQLTMLQTMSDLKPEAKHATERWIVTSDPKYRKHYYTFFEARPGEGRPGGSVGD